MKQKLLSLLVLLMTAATGAWAQYVDYDINVNFDPYYNPNQTHFDCMIMNPMDPLAEIKGTLELSVGGVSKGSFDVNGEMVDGNIAALDAGDYTWSAVFKPEGGGSFNRNGNFTINKADTYIYGDSGPINLGVGESTEVDVYLGPHEAGELSYSSGDASVASITKKEYSDNTYIIQANAAGTATITFSFAGSTNYKAADNKTITVTVGPAGPTVVASGNCGTSGHESEVTWTLTSDGVLTISGTGAMENYTNPTASPWYPYRNNFNSVVIESGVTSIGDFAFFGDGSLFAPSLTVTFAEGSTLTTIGTVAFSRANLTSIAIPASVTSIGDHAFDGCSNLATVALNSNPFIGDNAFDNIKDGATVTMNLTANLADGAKWTTFYNMNYNFQADANTQVFKVELSGTGLTMHEVEDKIVNACLPVVLKKSAEGNIVMTLTTAATSNTEPNSLGGVSDPAGLTASDPSTTYVLSYTAANGVGFYRLQAGKTLGVGKACLTYSGGGGAPERGYFEFIQSEEVTGIQSVDSGELTVESSEIYNLNGQRVTNPAPGIYIVNGKKVFIK